MSKTLSKKMSTIIKKVVPKVIQENLKIHERAIQSANGYGRYDAVILLVLCDVVCTVLGGSIVPNTVPVTETLGC